MTCRHVDASWIADGTSAKHGEKYGGGFGKARHTFHHVFQLRKKKPPENAGKKEILRNPVRNGFLVPKNKFLKTGVGNLAWPSLRSTCSARSSTPLNFT